MESQSDSSFALNLSEHLETESYALIDKPQFGEPSRGRRPALWLWILQATIFLSSCVVFQLSWYMGGSNTRCVEKLSMFSPALHLFGDDYEERRFTGTFKADSPWKGPPNIKVDTAWAIVAETPPFSVSEETLRKIKAPDIEASVKLPPESGGGYLAQFEVTHQLHCLNMLWQYSWFDYYRDKKVMWSDPPEIYRQHMEHCVDLLRQKIMCDADAGILTHSWVKNRTRAYPNFNVVHKCRNFEALLTWNLEHKAPIPNMGKIERLPGWTDLEEDP